MPDDELTRRFTALSERAAPLVDEPAVDAIRRRGLRHRRVRRAGALLAVAALALGAYLLTSAVGLGWPAGDLGQGPVAPAPPPPSAPATTPPPTTRPEPTTTTPTTRGATTTRLAPSSTTPPTTTVPVRGLRILEPLPGTVVRPGQTVRMRAVGCPPGARVTFEDGTSLRAGADGGFTTEFEIPPGPPGDFFLDATCGGQTREVRLRRSA
jgi:hypothetical protein